MTFNLSLIASSVLIMSLNASETSAIIEAETTVKETKKQFIYKKEINPSEFPYIVPIAVEEAPIEIITPKEVPVIEAPLPVEPPKEEVPKVEPDSDEDGIFDINDKCPNTPKVFNVDADGCPLTAILKLNFDENKYDIKDEMTENIQNFAKFLKDNTGYNALISGHTDAIGSNKANQILSENRANAVKKALVQEGVETERLTTIGEGEARPIADNLYQEGRAQNRRIEVELKSTAINEL